MNRKIIFLPCEDSFPKESRMLSDTYKTVEEAKKAILKDLY